jgi:hypothetical protein
MLAMALIPFGAFAVDGVVLINQSTVTAAGGFPYTISVEGSYKLSGNLVVPVGVNGINITASHVTLDLNGFSITGSPADSSFFIGINANSGGTQQAITVRNGSISGFTFPISLFSNSNLAEDLIISHTASSGDLQFRSGAVRRVVYIGGSIQIKCPAVVVESIAVLYNRDQSSSTACSFSSNSGTII